MQSKLTTVHLLPRAKFSVVVVDIFQHWIFIHSHIFFIISYPLDIWLQLTCKTFVRYIFTYHRMSVILKFLFMTDTVFMNRPRLAGSCSTNSAVNSSFLSKKVTLFLPWLYSATKPKQFEVTHRCTGAQGILNIKGCQKHIISSKVTEILLNGWILPIGEVACFIYLFKKRVSIIMQKEASPKQNPMNMSM